MFSKLNFFILFSSISKIIIYYRALINCKGGGTCNGGNHLSAYKFIKEHGLPDSVIFLLNKYLFRKNKCFRLVNNILLLILQSIVVLLDKFVKLVYLLYQIFLKELELVIVLQLKNLINIFLNLMEEFLMLML